MLEVEKYAPNIDQVAARANGLHPDCNQEQKAQLNNIVTGSHCYYSDRDSIENWEL